MSPYASIFPVFASQLAFVLTSSSAFRLPELYTELFQGPSPLWYSDDMVVHSSNLIKSYHTVVGGTLGVPVSLVDNEPARAAKELFFLPNRVVLSHGVQKGKDGPILNYCNSAALELWKGSWEQLTTLPSKYTAREENRNARQASMEAVLNYGFVKGYSGKRVGLDGEEFMIEDVTIWNIIVEGMLLGQAATFIAPFSSLHP